MRMVQSQTKREQQESGGVQVIARAAKILRVLAGHQDGLSLSQIAREVGLARSTVSRIVAALEAEYFITPSSSNGRIQLGPGFAPLAAAARLELHSFLEQLASEADETVDLAVLEEDQVFFIDQVTVSRRLRAVSTIGATFPLHCTANGKALLAEMSHKQVMQLLPEHLTSFTPHTITTREALQEELKRIGSEGVAYDREEHVQGICAIGASIPYTRSSMAAITIVLPSIRFYGNEQNLASMLLQICDRIKQSYLVGVKPLTSDMGIEASVIRY